MYTLQNYNSAIYNLKPSMRLAVALRPTLAVARSPTHPRQASASAQGAVLCCRVKDISSDLMSQLRHSTNSNRHTQLRQLWPWLRLYCEEMIIQISIV